MTVCETVWTAPSAPVLRSVGVGAEDGEAGIGVKVDEGEALDDSELGEEDDDKDEGSTGADAELDADADKEADPVGKMVMPGMLNTGSVGKLKLGRIPPGVGCSIPLRTPPMRAMDKGIKGKVLKKVGVEKGLFVNLNRPE